MNNELLTLYLRREPTVDPGWRQYGDGRTQYDVRYYDDPQATKPHGICRWDYRSKPRRGRKTMVLNCWRWNVVWLPDLEPAGAPGDGEGKVAA